MALTNLKAPIPKYLIDLIVNVFNQTVTVAWGNITGTLSNQTDLQNALNAKQNTLSLTTNNTSGAATLVGSTLNVPNYTPAWGQITGLLSSQTDLKDKLDSKVTLTGNETIAGVKEFTDGLIAFRAILNNNTLSYTLALSDRGKYIRCTANSDQTITVPTNLSIAFAVGTEIEFIRTTTSEVAFAAAGGVTLNSVDGNKRLNKRYSAAVLKKIGTDEWDLIGDLKA